MNEKINIGTNDDTKIFEVQEGEGEKIKQESG